MRYSDGPQGKRGTEGNVRGYGVAAGMPEGWLAPFLLLCLSDGCSYGHQLVKRLIGELGFDEIRLEEIYLALWRMEQDGMILCEPEDREIRLPEPRYEITEAGDAYLSSWADSIEQYRKEIKLFLHLFTGPDETLEQR